MASETVVARRHDIDALRVLCFAMLIVYHTSLIYGTRAWHIHASDSYRLVDLISIGSHPWRMSLLFFIAGLATAIVSNKKPIVEIRRSRTRQLLIPFLFGVIFIVPPQFYFSDFNTDTSYWVFWTRHMTSGLLLEHMWFLAYLWIYLFVWSILSPWFQMRWPGMASAYVSLLAGANFFLVPILFLSAIRLWLYPIFGEILVLTHDVYAHVLYFSMFVSGVLLMNEPRFWSEVDRQRWWSLAFASITFLSMMVLALSLPREQWPDTLVVVVRIVRSIFQWCTITALLAFAARFATRPNRVIAYFNKSMMTHYVAHQTVIVVVAYCLKRLGVLDIWSFLPVMIITVILCVLIAEAQKAATASMTSLFLVIKGRRTAPA
jgi:hypothetical protein